MDAYTPYTKDWKQPGSEKEEATRVEERGQYTDEDQAKEKRRGQSEVQGKERERKEATGRNQKRPIGKREPDSLMTPGRGVGGWALYCCSVGRQLACPLPNSALYVELGPSACL